MATRRDSRPGPAPEPARVLAFPQVRKARRAVLGKIAELALLYAAHGYDLGPLRSYREAIQSGRLSPPRDHLSPKERWVARIGAQRFDEAFLDEEIRRLGKAR